MMKDSWYRQAWIWILIGFSLLLVVSHVGYYYGHFGVDDMVYARMANDILTGEIDWSNHYSYRWTINGLTALSYMLFGINDHSSALPAGLLSIGIMYGILMCLRKRPWYECLAAGGLYCMYQWNVFYGDKLMPDIYVSAFVMLAWYAYRQQSTGELHPQRYACLLTIGLFLAFLSKGTVVLILPLFAYLFLSDLIQRRRLDYWGYTVGLHVVTYIIYGLILYMITGDPLARFQAIADNSYFNDCSYSEMPWSATIDRITTGFYTMMTKEYLYIYGIVGAATFITALCQRRQIPQAALTIVICMLSANVMSISFIGYNPMCLDPRHYLLFTPIMVVSTIECLQEIKKDHWSRLVLIGLVAIFIALLRDWTHIAIGLSLIVASWSFNNYRNIRLSYCLLAILTMLPSIQYMRYSKSLNYVEFRKEFVEVLASTTSPTRFYGSHVMNHLGEYYMAFDTSMATFRDITKSNFELSGSSQNILMKNWYCDWHSDLKEVTYNDWLEYENLEAVPTDSTNIFLNVFSLE